MICVYIYYMYVGTAQQNTSTYTSIRMHMYLHVCPCGHNSCVSIAQGMTGHSFPSTARGRDEKCTNLGHHGGIYHFDDME